MITNRPTGKLAVRPVSSLDPLVLYPWCERGLPSGWQGTLDHVYRIKIPNSSGTPARIVALMANLQMLTTGGSTGGEEQPPEIFVDCHKQTPEESSQEPFTRLRVACILDPIAGQNLPALPEATLSQTFAVQGGCAYLLQFFFQVCFPALNPFDPAAWSNVKVGSPPRWEVMWRDQAGKNLGTESQDLEIDPSDRDLEPAPWFIEVCLTVPSGAQEAELRFVNPFPLPGSEELAFALLLEQVSFAPTLQILCNGSFRQWEAEPDMISATSQAQRVPAGWIRVSGQLDRGLNAQTGLPVLELRGNGPDDAVLAQTVEVTGGDSLELRVAAQPQSKPPGDSEAVPASKRARLELRWLTASGGTTVGTPVTIPLDGTGFSEHGWAGTVPTQASAAELRLIQPRGKRNLRVEAVSLQKADTVPVPLIFLAEAPGELTISGLRVTYDLPAPPPPPSLLGVG